MLRHLLQRRPLATSHLHLREPPPARRLLNVAVPSIEQIPKQTRVAPSSRCGARGVLDYEKGMLSLETDRLGWA